MIAKLSFIHEFVPGSAQGTLLLLLGTGGTERDLIPLGRSIDPEANLLSPRGKVLENGMPRHRFTSEEVETAKRWVKQLKI